jgi:hypothetical protein
MIMNDESEGHGINGGNLFYGTTPELPGSRSPAGIPTCYLQN